MAKAVTTRRAADQPDAAVGADAIYRKLFNSFDPGQDGRISQLAVLSRLHGMSGVTVAPAKVVAVLLADGWHRSCRVRSQ